MIHLATGRRIARRGKAVVVLAALAGLTLLLAGCINMDTTRSALSAAGSRSTPYEEWTGDPVALSTVKSVAILPFANYANEPGFDAMAFATRLANQLTSQGRVRVVYPTEAMAAVKKENQRVKRHNADYRRRDMLGISIADERADQLQRAKGRNEEAVAGLEDRLLEEINPSRKPSDAVTIGRFLKVDAVVTGAITDFDPYMRPRMSVQMAVLGTGFGEQAAAELAQLTQWGVPRMPGSSANGKIWFRQQNFDSRDGNIGMGAYAHALRHHTGNNPYSGEAYISSITNYYDYVSAVLSGSLLSARSKAVKEAEQRALAHASRKSKDQVSVRNRIRRLVDPTYTLPDADAVIEANLGERRDKGWRPDVYNRSHPAKENALHPAYTAETGEK